MGPGLSLRLLSGDGEAHRRHDPGTARRRLAGITGVSVMPAAGIRPHVTTSTTKTAFLRISRKRCW